MSTFEVVAITSATSIVTLLLSRLRCIVRPCATDGDKCVSGCTDTPLRKDDHELDIQEYHIGGREVLIVSAKD